VRFDADVVVEEGLDVVASFLGTGDALQTSLQLVRAWSNR
jgi:hypothetical protein